MRYTFADKVLDSLDELRRGIRGWSKADHSQYFSIASAHNRNVLALHNGSLLSAIKIDGYMGQYTPQLFADLRDSWAKFLRTNANDKSAAGFDLFWSYEYDPEGMEDYTSAAREKMIQAGQRRGLDVRDINEEDARLYGSICARETQLLLVVTHIDSLPKADHKAALRMAQLERKGVMKGAGSAKRAVGLKALDAIHDQQVDKVLVHLQTAGFGYSCRRLDSYETLHAMRKSFLPSTTTSAWKAKLTPKDCRPRASEAVPVSVRDATKKDAAPHDWTVFLPPIISDQMVPQQVLDLGKFVVVDDRIYAPLYVSELAAEPLPLEMVLRMFYQRRLPCRIVYSLMANSNQANYWNRMFAGAFSFMSASNRQISSADRAMKAYEEGNGAVLGYALSIATWCKVEESFDRSKGTQLINTATIQKRAHDVETLLQNWGGQQLTSTFGCSVEALFSATPGYMVPPQAPLAPQTEYDILTQLPLMRPATLWEPQEAIWLRTSDGVLSPYQPMSSIQSAMLTLVLGGMGFGKSNMISEHIHFFANHPSALEMPYIRGMDFGASSSGVIDIIKASLPEGRKHEAVFEYFTNTGEMVKNLLDTRLGARYPLADHLTFLKNWLLILCDDLIERAGGVQNIVTVLESAILKAYKRKDDRIPGHTVPRYRHSVADPIVRDAVEQLGVEVDDRSNYWEITEALLEIGLERRDNQIIYAAKVAQRDCSPTLADLVMAVTEIKDEFVSAPLLDGSTHICNAVANALTNANRLFPCFAGKTNRDISESRVCVFDMSTVFGRDSGVGADWNRSVFFAAAMRLLTEDLFVSTKETGAELKLRCSELFNGARNETELAAEKDGKPILRDKLLHWHFKYLETQDQIMKVFWADEIHRVGKVRGALSLLDSLAYEGRKYRVGLLLGTQMPEHMPADMLKLATSIFIFGASQSSENAKNMQKLFDLTDDERQIVENITKPNAKKGAEVFAIHKVDTRAQRLKLHFNIGLIKRWAYATEGPERALRGVLYAKGPSTTWARRILAERVPDLTATLKQRKDASGNEDLSEIELIEGLAKELLAQQ